MNKNLKMVRQFLIAACLSVFGAALICLIDILELIGAAFIIAALTLPSIAAHVILGRFSIRRIWRNGLYVASLLPLALHFSYVAVVGPEGKGIALFVLAGYCAASACAFCYLAGTD